MSNETQNPFRLTNPSARDVLVEFDKMVEEKEKEGYDKDSARDYARKFQKEKYWNNKPTLSSE